MNSLSDNYKPYQGIYIHIPHCLQKCHYCDFPTVLLDDGPGLDHYTQLIEKELEFRLLQDMRISSIYFGGGTPSLLGPQRIVRLIQKVFAEGYYLTNPYEITVEINPGTLNKSDIVQLIDGGVNRFSVGVQSFKNETLKLIGREHSAEDTIKTLELLKESKVNFTADLILALPGEDFSIFRDNAKTLISFDPNHLSVYVLTVPEKSFLAKNMPKDDLLDELMDNSEHFLFDLGYERYEISNYMKRNGSPSLHNLLYWNDLNYWGVGLGAHSYFKDSTEWGLRFWNSRSLSSYEAHLKARGSGKDWPTKSHSEALQLNESLTDFCFTHLRQWKGLSEKKILAKYPLKIRNLVVENLLILQKDGYIESDGQRWRLSQRGRKFADHVFRQLCFSKSDLED